MLTGLALLGPRLWGYVDRPGREEDDPLPNAPPDTPFDQWDWAWFPERFTGDHVAAGVLALAVMAGLAVFFRYTRIGVGIRGAAENTDRASQLGINTGTLSTVVWVLTASIAGLAGVLEVGAEATSLQVLSLTGATSVGAVLLPTLDPVPEAGPLSPVTCNL